MTVKQFANGSPGRVKAVLVAQLAHRAVVGIGGQLRRGADLKSAERVAEVNDQQGAVGVAAQILVLLKIGVG